MRRASARCGGVDGFRRGAIPSYFGSLTRMVLAKTPHRLEHAYRKSTAEISFSVNRSG
jgi:hypothetical protein